MLEYFLNVLKSGFLIRTDFSNVATYPNLPVCINKELLLNY